MGSGKAGHSTSPSRTLEPSWIIVALITTVHGGPCGCGHQNSRVYRFGQIPVDKVIVPTSEKSLEAAKELCSSLGTNQVNLEMCPDWTLSSKSRHIQIQLCYSWSGRPARNFSKVLLMMQSVLISAMGMKRRCLLCFQWSITQGTVSALPKSWWNVPESTREIRVPESQKEICRYVINHVME